jgi:hypothetical protein
MLAVVVKSFSMSDGNTIQFPDTLFYEGRCFCPSKIKFYLWHVAVYCTNDIFTDTIENIENYYINAKYLTKYPQVYSFLITKLTNTVNVMLEAQ